MKFNHAAIWRDSLGRIKREVEREILDTISGRHISARGLDHKDRHTWKNIKGVAEEVRVCFCAGIPEVNVTIDGVRYHDLHDIELGDDHV